MVSRPLLVNFHILLAFHRQQPLLQHRRYCFVFPPVTLAPCAAVPLFHPAMPFARFMWSTSDMTDQINDDSIITGCRNVITLI